MISSKFCGFMLGGSCACRRIELEHAVRLALGDHIVHGLIVQRDILGLHIHARVAHEVERVADDGQRAQTKGNPS